MGSLFTRPPARAGLPDLAGRKLALDPSAAAPLGTVEASPPLVVCIGSERQGLPAEVREAADAEARIPLRAGGPESLNAAMAATLALYDLANRMAARD
jgi:tRNA G18 (ribose-2'-O)-methylase SpoU